jgi:trimeric autotransporter adhesin
MSTKTNFKRVALVAVAALGLGVLTSVAPANATTFGTADTLILGTDNTANGTAVGGVVLTIATPGISSSGIISTTGGTAVANDATDYAYKKLVSGATATGIVYPGAKLGFGLDATAKGSIIVSGGTWGSVTGTTGINGSYTTIVGTTAAIGGVVTVNAAAGATVTVSSYTGAGVTIDTPTNGALVGIWTFTVASASAAGVPSLADSTITQQAAIAKGAAASTTLTYDTGSRMANGTVGLIYVSLADAYGSAVTSGTLTATTTAGTVNAVVAGSAASGDSYAAVTAFDSVANSSGAFYVYVNQPVANTAGSATVTLTLSGSVIGTKTLNWAGDAATIALIPTSSSANFANGYAAYSSADAKNLNVAYVVKDAAGNAVTLTTQPTLSDATGALLGASLSAATDTTGTAAAKDIDTLYQTSSNGYGLATMLVPSSTLSGAGSYTLSFVNAAGATIKSSVNTATVSRGSINSFEASWDKASYLPGEIATVTITAKDAYGNLISDGVAAAGLDLVVSTSGLTAVGTALSTSSLFSAGKITQKYAAGNTDGAYAYSVDITTATPQSASVGSVKVAGATGVSNADVLKAIVSLIASINKQIAALQKALLKK